MAKALYSTFDFCLSKICFLNKNITSYLLAQLECSIRSLFLLYSIYGKDLRDAQLCFFTNLLTTKINKDQFDDDWFKSSNRPKIYLRNEDKSRICYMALSLGFSILFHSDPNNFCWDRLSFRDLIGSKAFSNLELTTAHYSMNDQVLG
jgi:hypothetical protein